ncbi:hypothetical protein F4782DRAFT_120629 [Xylaria castorea]|nr:hypothetical protein F4782DRAFT_120629 [Xylaria castorea]
MPVSSPTSTSSHMSEGVVKTYKRRPRKPINCQPCRHSKLRCDRQIPCVQCVRRKCADSCLYERPPGAFRSVEPRVHREPESRPEPASTPCQPGTEHNSPGDVQTASVAQGLADITPAPKERGLDLANVVPPDLQERHALTHERWEEVLQRPMNPNEPSAFAPDDTASRSAGLCFPFASDPQLGTSDLLAMIPSASSCDYLISRFFMYMAQFFPILHGPTFQKEYAAFVANPSAVDLSWLSVLFMLLSIGLHTLDYDDALPADIKPNTSPLQDSSKPTRRYREAAMMCLSKAQFLTRYQLSTLQALLFVIYEICHEEGVEHGWTLLGIALNISIALHCNDESAPPGCKESPHLFTLLSSRTSEYKGSFRPNVMSRSFRNPLHKSCSKW